MSMLLYLHGFNSSPQSKKAVETQRWMVKNTPAIKFICPQLSPYASDVMSELRLIVEAYLPQPIFLVGSSMGGFFATCLAEQYNLPAVLINPAVNPGSGLHSWLGENENFMTGERWNFEITVWHSIAIRVVISRQSMEATIVLWIISDTCLQIWNFYLTRIKTNN